MSHTSDTQVLIAGGGPIGLTAAIELARRGIASRIVDPLVEPLQYAKAVGVQPRTLEVFEGMGVLRRILDAALPMRGQIVYVNGERAQGMNTGIQDAHNLAWKLALALAGQAAPGLLETYDAERRPVGEVVVGRTVRSAREGIGADSTDVDYVMRREAQLLIEYAGSPIVAGAAGGRAPDATGLTRDAVTGPLRLFSLLGGREHIMLLYAPDGPVDVATYERAADAAVSAANGRMDVYMIASPGADAAATVLPLIRDTAGDFAKAYAPAGPSAYVVRPDGYLGLAAAGVDPAQLVAHLGATFARPEGDVAG